MRQKYVQFIHLVQKLRTNNINLPPTEQPPNLEEYCDYQDMQYVRVADNAFPSTTYMVKPYPGRCTGTVDREELYNYRYIQLAIIIKVSLIFTGYPEQIELLRMHLVFSLIGG